MKSSKNNLTSYSLPLSSSSGFGIIEVLIAVMTTAVILTGIAILLSVSVRNASEAKYREESTERSQEIIEYLRRYRITEGWGEFSNYIGGHTYCLPQDFEGSLAALEWLPNDVPSPDSCDFEPDAEINTEFKRVLMVSDIENNALIATVSATWKSGTEEKSVSLERLFTNY